MINQHYSSTIIKVMSLMVHLGRWWYLFDVPEENVFLSAMHWHAIWNALASCCPRWWSAVVLRIYPLRKFLSTEWGIPDSKVYGANMGPIWGRRDPGGPHVDPTNLAIWDAIEIWCNGHGNAMWSISSGYYTALMLLPYTREMIWEYLDIST